MRTLEEVIAEALGDEVVASSAVHGGDTATARRVELASGRRVFAKTHPDPPAGFFTTEAAGLSWLREVDALPIPEVLAVSDGDGEDPAHLVLEWIERGAPTTSTEADLGRALATLHAASPARFGRDDRRTTGSLGIPNQPCESWAEFFATQRLAPLARIARDELALSPTALATLDRLDADRLTEIGGPAEPPARLHGDLWGGNRVVGTAGESWLIDPAAHGGHREFDLAMMRLFGGFGPDCFAAYEEVAPLADGWRGRIELHQLPPLVVHAIRFGGSYPYAAAEALAAYA